MSAACKSVEQMSSRSISLKGKVECTPFLDDLKIFFIGGYDEG